MRGEGSLCGGQASRPQLVMPALGVVAAEQRHAFSAVTSGRSLLAGASPQLQPLGLNVGIWGGGLSIGVEVQAAGDVWHVGSSRRRRSVVWQEREGALLECWHVLCMLRAYLCAGCHVLLTSFCGFRTVLGHQGCPSPTFRPHVLQLTGLNVSCNVHEGLY